jgi:hypothetical protein
MEPFMTEILTECLRRNVTDADVRVSTVLWPYRHLTSGHRQFMSWNTVRIVSVTAGATVYLIILVVVYWRNASQHWLQIVAAEILRHS